MEQSDASGAFLHTQRGADVEVSLTRSLMHKGQDLLIALRCKRVCVSCRTLGSVSKLLSLNLVCAAAVPAAEAARGHARDACGRRLPESDIPQGLPAAWSKPRQLAGDLCCSGSEQASELYACCWPAQVFCAERKVQAAQQAVLCRCACLRRTPKSWRRYETQCTVR